jgi:hypothetical protein
LDNSVVRKTRHLRINAPPKKLENPTVMLSAKIALTTAGGSFSFLKTKPKAKP